MEKSNPIVGIICEDFKTFRRIKKILEPDNPYFLFSIIKNEQHYFAQDFFAIICYGNDFTGFDVERIEEHFNKTHDKLFIRIDEIFESFKIN